MNFDGLTSSATPLPPELKKVRRIAKAPDFERALAPYQLLSAKAYVDVLQVNGIIKGEIADRLIQGLVEIESEIASGKSFVLEQDPDLYTGLVRRLSQITGTISERILHGRTDENWLAVDTRLWMRDNILLAMRDVLAIRAYLIELADQHRDIMMPGYAHMQPTRRQPFTCYFLALDTSLRGDFERLRQLFDRVNRMPAGLDSLILEEQPTDRALMASKLSFDGVINNSVDSSMDFDHLIEFSSVSALLGTHLSRYISELLLWTTHEFGYLRLPRSLALADEQFFERKSSEVLELLRARIASITADCANVMTTFRGLPTGATAELFECLDTVNEMRSKLHSVLLNIAAIFPALIFDTKRISESSEMDMINRGNAVDYLIEKGFTPDKAVSLVEPLVEYCRKRQRSMSDLAPAEWQEFSPAFDHDIYKYVIPDKSTGTMGPRLDILERSIVDARNMFSHDEAHRQALSEKVRALAVEVRTSSE